MTYYDHAVLLAHGLDVWDQSGETRPGSNKATPQSPIGFSVAIKRAIGYLITIVTPAKEGDECTSSKSAPFDRAGAKACQAYASRNLTL